MVHLTAPPTELIWYAFRYALGRDTAAPEIVVDYLIKNYPNIPADDMYVFEREVEKFIEATPNMALIDTWKKVLYLYDTKYHCIVKRPSGSTLRAISMDGGFYSPDFSCKYVNVRKVAGTW